MSNFFHTFFSMHNRYFPALILIALFSFFAYINMNHIINSIENDAEIINKSGKQRMLSQNLVLLGLNYLHNPTKQNQDAIKTSVQTMRSSHEELLKIEQNDAIKEIYNQKKLSQKIELFLNKFELFLEDRSNDLLNELSIDAQEILPLLSNIVKEYEILNNTKVEELKQRQLLILIFTLILLILELVFVFYPTSKKIKSHTNELLILNNSLEQKIKEEVDKNRQKDRYLAQQSRLAQMGEMIHMIAHQWRQPLSAINSAASTVELEAVLQKQTKESTLKQTKHIATLIEYLSHTIDDFREFFKPTKTKNDIHCDEIIDSIINIVDSSLKNHNITFKKEFMCNKKLYTYVNELKQVILSIISNAQDALAKKKPQNPYINLLTYTEGNFYVIEISDNGGGVPQEIIDQIFNPYFTTKEHENGTGLGLYMSKIIIEDHCEGSITISNNEDGAVFKIVIPLK